MGSDIRGRSGQLGSVEGPGRGSRRCPGGQAEVGAVQHPDGEAMKIPLWMLQPEAARFHLSEQIDLSSCALRALVDLLTLHSSTKVKSEKHQEPTHAASHLGIPARRARPSRSSDGVEAAQVHLLTLPVGELWPQDQGPRSVFQLPQLADEKFVQSAAIVKRTANYPGGDDCSRCIWLLVKLVRLVYGER